MRRLLLVAAALSAPASAAPTYLSCVLQDGGKGLPVNVTADEQNQFATIELVSSGHFERRPAMFSATTVSFDLPSQAGDPFFRISRMDLSIERVVGASAKLRGSCKIETPAQRAF